MPELTEADAKNWRMVEAAHYNGGKVFFAYLHRCVEQPRLSRYDRYERKTRSVTSTWRVDGADRPSFSDAIEALNTPPAFTDQEVAILRTFSDEPEDRREEMCADQEPYPWHSLREKGAIVWQARRCTITETGRRAIADKVVE